MGLYYRAAKPSRQEGILQASFVKVFALGVSRDLGVGED